MNVTRSIVGGLAAAGLVLGLGSAASATPSGEDDYEDCCKKEYVKKEVEKKEVEKKEYPKKEYVKKEYPKKEYEKKEYKKYYPKKDYKHHDKCCPSYYEDSYNDYELDFESEIDWESVIINTFGHR